MKLVSFLTPPFWPGLRALAHSLAHRGNIKGLDWIVMTEEKAPDEWRDWLFLCGFGMQNLLFSQVGELPKQLPKTRKYFEPTWNRLRMFLLPEGEYISLDVDLLCVGDATELLTAPSISAVACPAGGWTAKGINSGLIRFDADPLMFNECLGEVEAAGDSWMALADQATLNRVFTRRPELLRGRLAGKWNTKSTGTAPLSKAIFIHFAGQIKPWMNGGGVNKIWTDYANGI